MNQSYYSIERTDYGLRMEFNGLMEAERLALWLKEFKSEVDRLDGSFFAFVDLRSFKPISEDGQELIIEGQSYARENGMKRSVVILNNPVTTLQFKRLAQESGIYEWERYIDASNNPDWEQIGLDWLIKAADPAEKLVPLPNEIG